MTKNTEKKMTSIQDLIDYGKKQGKLTSLDIDKFLEGVSFDVEQVDKLYETLETNNIDVIDIIEEEEEVLKKRTLKNTKNPVRISRAVHMGERTAYPLQSVIRTSARLSKPSNSPIATNFSLISSCKDLVSLALIGLSTTGKG